MKKILALILVLGCLFMFASCNLLFPTNDPDNQDPDDTTETPDDSASVSDIQAKVDATAPKGADIAVTYNTALGTLTGTYDVAYNEDGTATVNYSYEKFNTFTAGQTSSELKSTVTGTATVAADGTVSGDLNADGLTAVSFNLKLDETKLAGTTINAGILSATVKAADTAAVLGVALNYDVQLNVATGANGATSVTVAYTTNMGEVEILTLYK